MAALISYSVAGSVGSGGEAGEGGLSAGAFFYLGFIHESQDCKKRGGHFFNSSVPPLPPASQTLRH